MYKRVIDGEQNFSMPINYEVQNNSDEEIDSSKILLNIYYYNALSQGIAQNINDDEKNTKMDMTNPTQWMIFC